MAALERFGLGLLWSDDFNRLDETSNPEYNEQIWFGAGLALVSNILVNEPVNGQGAWNRPQTVPDEFMVQCNMRGDFPETKARYIDGLSATAQNGYRFRHRVNFSRVEILKDAIIVSASPPIAINNSSWFTTRAVVEVPTPNTLLRYFWAGPIASSEDISFDLVQQTQALDTISPKPNDLAHSFHGPDSNNTTSTSWDRLFITGRYIVVSGVPTGFKVQIDSRTPVISTGGDVIVDPVSWAMPFTTITILDLLDVPVDSDSPAGGVWPGDQWIYQTDVIRTGSGLVFFDAFGRPSNNNLLNGWDEAEDSPSTLVISTQNSQQVVRNTRNSDSNSERYSRLLPDPGLFGAGDLISQINFDHLNGSTGGVGILTRVPPPVTQVSVAGVFVQWSNPSGGTVDIGGGGAIRTSITGLAPGIEGALMRQVTKFAGPGAIEVDAYFTPMNTTPYLAQLDFVPVLVGSVSWSSPTNPSDAYGLAHARLGNSKMYFSCGRGLLVTSLPTGWKARLQPSGLTEVEVGGNATFDIDALPLPQQDLEILDDLDVVQFTFTPPITPGAPGGIWGGDEYDFAGAPPAPDVPTNFDCACNEDLLQLDLSWDDVSGEDGYNIYRSDDPLGPFVLIDTVGADVVTYSDTDVEIDTRYYYYITSFVIGAESDPSRISTCQTRPWTVCTGPPATPWTKLEDATLCPIPYAIEFVSQDPLTTLDDFNRSDRDLDGDNGWTEIQHLMEMVIVANQGNSGDTDENDLIRNSVVGGATQDFIINTDVVSRIGIELNGFGLLTHYDENDPTGKSYYMVQTNPDLSEISIWKRTDGASFVKEASFSLAHTEPYGMRGVFIHDGSDLIIQLLLDNVEYLQWTDTAPFFGGNYNNVGYRINNPDRFDNFLICPPAVTINDVPDGFGISLDASTINLEVSNIVTIDMIEESLPQQFLYLHDTDGIVVVVFEGTIFGGDVYEVTSG